jgi:hypothetical protein
MTDNVKKEATAPEQTQPQTEGSNDLSINDLNAMKVIIDIASSRGAFKPNEMSAVGQTYNKLTAFLDSVAKQAEAAGKAGA